MLSTFNMKELWRVRGNWLCPVCLCQSASCQAGRWYYGQSDWLQTLSKLTAPFSWPSDGECPSMHWTQQLWKDSSSPGLCNPELQHRPRDWKTQLFRRHRLWHRWERSTLTAYYWANISEFRRGYESECECIQLGLWANNFTASFLFSLLSNSRGSVNIQRAKNKITHFTSVTWWQDCPVVQVCWYWHK